VGFMLPGLQELQVGQASHHQHQYAPCRSHGNLGMNTTTFHLTESCLRLLKGPNAPSDSNSHTGQQCEQQQSES
jgi:hypothetical protein